MKSTNSKQTKYGFMKCDECDVLWKMMDNGKIVISTKTCAGTHLCDKCVLEMSKLVTAKNKVKAAKEKVPKGETVQ